MKTTHYRPSQSRTRETESETCTFRTSLFHKYAQLLRERDLSWMNENDDRYVDRQELSYRKQIARQLHKH